MKIPRVHGVIRRRLLINFRVDPAVAKAQLPPQFEPKLHAGYAVGGICLIRLEEMRPNRVPQLFGLSSENAAHRFAVTWTDSDGVHEGVYIPRRDSASMLTHLAGGRLFSGEYHRAQFDVSDDGDRVELAMQSADGKVSVKVAADASPTLAEGSIFDSLEAASSFFEPGSLGYSATASGRRLDGVVLRTQLWEVRPLRVQSVESSYFSEESLFPAGSIAFDCALIMRNIEHEWQSVAERYV